MASLEQQQQQLWQQQQQQQVNYNLSTTTTTNANVTTSDHPSIVTATLCAYDPELSPIPDQQAYAILDLYGNIIRSSNPSTSSSSIASSSGDIIKDAPILYKMIVESTSLVLASASATGQEEKAEGFELKRMTITFDTVRYVIARDENHIYLLQTSTTTK
ncbi:hypothetical protein FRACYDRAFT_271859 [Fragilariopsis cylindrus CCMP1102]|uniref:Late endosomal/lysosomal adaptor and MAPK and MTOR activator 4 n=1 Tax=Fragilariopsis cylindrus CCMP1102 TaxID=635003 RepID=A0A1E7EQS2_9STRA|nr:hypothetical protein FRACYDRAFT_271859 [Fragilariopsis cylindrus CCMP1102]|eukprot:OEU08156.1 hypothetical protein FRACYDRAFT_271859 [Fragilariopsis cylindrus CCMP1102]